jgi:hypothetical protein
MIIENDHVLYKQDFDVFKLVQINSNGHNASSVNVMHVKAILKKISF